tara:strand:+ start:322 stop:1185 length:864 start_codon:yes stop_codon:yes gene_type:complete
MAYEIYLGCEQLGGTDWGNYDIEETIKLAKSALKIGFDGFDIADCYSLGLAEKRLSEVIQNSNIQINLITKGGIRWERNENRARTWKDSSPEYLKGAIKNSLKRLGISKIPIYLIHWHDSKIDIIDSLNSIKEVKEDGLIEKIGLSNPSISWLKNPKILSIVDHIQVKDNLLSPFPFPSSFSINKKKYNINVSSYGTLSHGLLTNKYNENHSYSKNDRRHRLNEFKDLNLIKKRNKLYNYALKNNRTLEEISINYTTKNKLIDIMIIGCKTFKQANLNINYFNDSLK